MEMVLMYMPAWSEMWPIILIIFVLFGAKKLPELAHAVGESLKEFKKATNDLVNGDEKPAISDHSDDKKA